MQMVHLRLGSAGILQRHLDLRFVAVVPEIHQQRRLQLIGESTHASGGTGLESYK